MIDYDLNIIEIISNRIESGGREDLYLAEDMHKRLSKAIFKLWVYDLVITVNVDLNLCAIGCVIQKYLFVYLRSTIFDSVLLPNLTSCFPGNLQVVVQCSVVKVDPYKSDDGSLWELSSKW